MTGGLLDRLIARAEAELAALEADAARPDRARGAAEVRERLRRLQELRADTLRRPAPAPTPVRGVRPLRFTGDREPAAG